MITKDRRQTKLAVKKRKIKIYLAERGLTQRDLAKLFDVKPPFISQLLEGKRRSARIQDRIAVLFGVSYEELWDDAAGDNGHDEEDTTTLD